MIDTKSILDLWLKLRETPKEFVHIHEFSHGNPWDHSVRRELEQAFELDPEGLTALLLLDNFRNDFFSNCGISVQDMLENKNVEAFVNDCRQLTNMLSDTEIVEALDGFVGNITNAIEHMAAKRDDVADMLNNRYEMSILRRDALRSMDTLAFHQFFQGETKMDHLAYLPDIHVFWNMNSLVRCAWQSPDGVSINLIKDPLDTSSYFAFVAKNGGNLTVLTDKPKEAHPLSKYMSRRPEKSFTSRVFRNHFPYGLLDLSFDRKGYAHPGKTSLVPLQSKPIKIGSVAEMEPDEIIWTVMMFSLIDGKLYKENYHCGELSYTSDMIADPQVAQNLLASAQNGALMVKNYKPLEAPILTTDSFENDAQYSRYEGSGLHNWIFERYKDQIPEDILNGLLPNDGSTLFLLPGDTTFLAPKERVKIGFHNNIQLKSDKARYYTNENGSKILLESDIVEGAIPLEKMTGDEFGSADNLIKDYTWFARYNAAKFVQQKAKEEYEARKDEVQAWIKERIQQNLERISKDILCNLLGEQKQEHPCRFAMIEFTGRWWDTFSTIGCFKFVKDRLASYRNPRTNHNLLYNKSDAGCWFSDDAPCSYLLKAQPIEVEDLLYLTGCESIEELPDVLQHWHNSGYADKYTGNAILDRVDPMDWVVKNPWNEMHFGVVIGIGKKYLSKAKKEFGLVPKQ